MSMETTKSNDSSKEINVEETDKVDLKGYEGLTINATEFAVDERTLGKDGDTSNSGAADSSAKSPVKSGTYNSIVFKNYVKEIFQGMVVKLKGKEKETEKSEEELQAEAEQDKDGK